MLKWPLAILLFNLAAAAPASAHFLWKVEGEKPSYLYGTIHSSDEKVRDIPKPVLDALAESSTFHPELEFSPENLGTLSAAVFSGSGDLEKELPPRLWNRVRQHAEKSGIPAALLRRVPLQLLPVLFATPPESDFNHVIDVQLYTRAKENGIPIHQLETVEEQLNVFRALPREAALAFLEEAIAEAEKGFPTMNKTIRLYSEGDLSGLEKFLREEFDRYDLPQLEEALITERNRHMAKRLEPYLKTGGAFIAVGVGHLPGEQGILDLLQKTGHQITPVKLR